MSQIRNGVRPPESLEIQVANKSEMGYTGHDIAQELECSDSTVHRILQRMGVIPKETTKKMRRATGNAAMRVAMAGWEYLERIVTNRPHTIQPAQLGVLAGIASSRAIELLNEDTEVEAPNWSNISIDHIVKDPQLAIEQMPDVTNSVKSE